MLPYKLPNDCRPDVSKLGNTRKILKLTWNHSLVPSITRRNKFLALALKNYGKADTLSEEKKLA